MAENRKKNKMITAKILSEKPEQGTPLAVQKVFDIVTELLCLTLFQIFCIQTWNAVFFEAQSLIVVYILAFLMSGALIALQWLPVMKKLLPGLMLFLLPWPLLDLWLIKGPYGNSFAILISRIYEDLGTYYKLTGKFYWQIVWKPLDSLSMGMSLGLLLIFLPFSYGIARSFYGKPRKLPVILGMAFNFGIFLITGQMAPLTNMLCLVFITVVIAFLLQERTYRRHWGSSSYFGAAIVGISLGLACYLGSGYTITKLQDTLIPLQDYIYSSSLEEIVSDIKTHVANPGNGSSVAGGQFARGRLSQTGNLKVETKTDLVVKLSKALEYPIYLKGYVGGRYDGRNWEEANENDIKNKLVDYDGWVSQGWLAIEPIEVPGADEWADLKITYTERAQNDRVIPYFSKATGSLKAQEVPFRVYLPNYNRLFLRINTLLQFEKTMEVPEIAERYLDYVNVHYLQVSNTVERLREDVDVFMQTDPDLYDKIYFVRDFLASHATYSLKPGRIESKDFIDTFLYVKKSGYCMHFASAATIMFRLMGVPARYVEGYVVWNYPRANVESSLSGENMHAWTEIYIRECGWMPIEVTPGYSGSSLEVDPYETQAPTTAASTEERTTKPSATADEQTSTAAEKTTAADKATQDASKDPTRSLGQEEAVEGDGGPGFPWGKVLLYSLGTVGIIFGIWMLFSARRQWISGKRKHALTSKNRTQAVTQLYREITELTRREGLAFSYETSPVKLKVRFALPIETDELEQIIQIIEKALFSNSEIEEEEYRKVLRLYKLLRRSIREKSSFVQRFIFDWIVCR